MLLEFDADQRLWQDTVRDAVGKQCPSSLVRAVAEDGAEGGPSVDALWKAYVDAGWTELTDPENAVELAIVLEEMGRGCDPTPFLSTITQFAPLVGDRFDPLRSGTAVYSGVGAVRDAEGWVLSGTDRFVLDGDRARAARRRHRRRRLPGRRAKTSAPVASTSSIPFSTWPRCHSPVCGSPTPTDCPSTRNGRATSR